MQGLAAANAVQASATQRDTSGCIIVEHIIQLHIEKLGEGG
jgi:hypothetical protein